MCIHFVFVVRVDVRCAGVSGTRGRAGAMDIVALEAEKRGVKVGELRANARDSLF